MDGKIAAIALLSLANLIFLRTSIVEANWLTNLFSHSQAQDAHATFFGADAQPHPGSWTHALIAAAIGFEAMRAYEDKVARDNGVAPTHSIMKELLAGFAAAAADRLFETHGLDWLDKELVTGRATENAHHIAKERYGEGSSRTGL